MVSTAPARKDPTDRNEERITFLRIVVLLLALAVGISIPIEVLLVTRDGGKAVVQAPQATAGSMARMAGMTAAGAAATPSFAGAAPENADALAAAHKPYDAALPPLQAGDVVKVNLVLKDITVQIAPGVKYAAWAWAGGAPGPVIHVRQGQTVKITLTNKGAIPHSVDFHAGRVAPDKNFIDVFPGKSFTFSFKANDPGVFMYHCGTKPVLMHIANGMYGAIVVEPSTPLPHADKQYVLVASEWYLDRDGVTQPAQFDMAKAHAKTPDWMTFNGYAGQYVKHPLTADPGDTVRFWVMDAGPSIDTDFHIVGTILDRAWIDSDLTQHLNNVQTAQVPAGGGGVFDVKIDEPGLYPFVSHAFAAVDQGQVGLLNVGHVAGTMSH
jgi:nitrite reductase (NO-forming)